MESTSFGVESSIKLLIVEDEKNLGELLADHLARQNLTIEVARDGNGACDKIKKSLYDVVLTEIAVPGASCLEVLQAAKNANPNALVIIITTHSSIEKAAGAVKKGAYDFITKPFKLDELDVTVSHAIDNVRLTREREKLLESLKSANEELKSLKGSKSSNNRKRGERIAFSEGVSTAARVPMFDLLPMHYSGRFGSKADDLMEKLDRLNKLKEKGALTVDEYFVLKGKLFSPGYDGN